MNNDNKKVVASQKGDSFRLRAYYYLAEGAGMAVPLAVAVLLYLLPHLFEWIVYQEFTMIALVAVFIAQSVFLILHEITGAKFFFNINRYVYAVMFMVFIVGTGGLSSSFYFLLMFPLIVSAVYLDANITKRMGFTITIFLAFLIFLYPDAFHDPSAISKHIIITILFGLLSFMMYKIVIETLKQKYEKEETTKKFGELIEIERIKNDFLSIAQHQLRTPLSGLKWALETLKSESGVSAEDNKLIDEGITRANDAIGIVNEMLTTADDSKHALTLTYKKLDLVRLLNTIMGELSYVAMAKSVSVKTSIPESLEIQGDLKKLKASLINVIDNSLKYSPNGTVSIELRKDGEFAVMTVMDTGIGISPNDLPYVFDRLYRAKNAIAVEPNESGVGLYTARKIVELHGGTVSLVSTLGKGTTVKVVLPVEQVNK